MMCILSEKNVQTVETLGIYCPNVQTLDVHSLGRLKDVNLSK